jgi:DHA2 family multidrug resistance protein
MISLFAFATGSLLAALAPNLTILVVFRIFQGLGGGAMMPVGMAMVYELFPPDQRGTALGIWGEASMAAPALGPVLGGYLVTTVSWRWLFLINVPIGYVGLVVARRLLRDTGYREHRTFDATGLGLVGAGLILLLLAFSEAPEWGWGSPTVLVMMAAGGLLTAAFVVYELRVEQPLIDVRMFKIGTFSLTMVIVGLATLLQYGRLVFIPLELQTLRGYSALKVGFILTPSALGAAVTMPIGGRLTDRIGSKVPVVFGSLLLTVSAWLLANLSYTSSILSIVIMLSIGGLGTGFAIMPNTVAAMNSVSARFTAQASAARSTCRQVAGALGVAILSSIVAARIGAVSAVADTPKDLGQGAYNAVFYVAAAAGLLSALLGLGLPGRRRTKEVQQARAAEADTIAAMEVEGG